MTSHYLGTVIAREKLEIHAFTSGHKFRWLSEEQVSDLSLFDKLQKARFQVLQSGRPIYCTAVAPNLATRRETNPHDVRPGTIHFVALTSAGDIRCGVSVAIDAGVREQGELIGLPLENRWQAGDYPPGASLDTFRANYVINNYGEDRPVLPWEMGELYRHFKIGDEHNPISRLAIYSALHHLLVDEANRRQLNPTWLWLFDAIPEYYELYRLAGAAVLREQTLQRPRRYLAPAPDALTKSHDVFLGAEIVSRDVDVPIPTEQGGRNVFLRKPVAFLDGLVDVRRLLREIKRTPGVPKLKEYWGMRMRDRFRLRTALALTAGDAYTNHHGDHWMVRNMEMLARREFKVQYWSIGGHVVGSSAKARVG